MSQHPHFCAIILLAYDLVMSFYLVPQLAQRISSYVQHAGLELLVVLIHSLYAAGFLVVAVMCARPPSVTQFLKFCGVVVPFCELRADLKVAVAAVLVGVGFWFLFSVTYNLGADMGSQDISGDQWISAAVIAPLIEEVIFTGFLFRLYRTRYVLWASLTFMAIVAGIAHTELVCDFWELPRVMLMMTVFCAYREISRSLWPSIFCHGSYNAASAFLH